MPHSRVVAIVAALAGVAIYAAGILHIKGEYDAQIARGWVVEGKGLWGAFFNLSAIAGLCLGVAASSAIASIYTLRTRPFVRVVIVLALLSVVVTLSIRTGIALGFIFTY